MNPSPFVADLSNNNGASDVFNAEKYRQAGHVLIGLKASEGTHFLDPRHRGWALAAGSRHVRVMHYHFGRPDLNPDGAHEAEWFLHATAGLLGPHDYVVYDGERTRAGHFGLQPDHARAFDAYIQEHTRFHSILYASGSQLAGAENALVGDNRRDWDANYSNQPDSHAPGHVCVLRQFTDGVLGPEPHSVVGVRGHCDISIMRGAFAQQVFANAR